MNITDYVIIIIWDEICQKWDEICFDVKKLDEICQNSTWDEICVGRNLSKFHAGRNLSLPSVLTGKVLLYRAFWKDNSCTRLKLLRTLSNSFAQRIQGRFGHRQEFYMIWIGAAH